MQKLLLYTLPHVACVMLMCFFAFAAHELPSAWQQLALIAFLLIWSPVSDWLIGRDGKQPQAIWKDVANMVTALITVVLASLLVGWTGGKLVEMYGSWMFKAIAVLLLALGIISIIRLMRRKRSTAADDQQK